MEEDTDSPPERETKDFHFRQLKKTRLFDPPQEILKERSNLLAISNKYGLIFAGGSPGLKIYYIKDLLVPIKAGEDPNSIVAGPPGITVPLKLSTHHVALSSDSLTLSVCVASSTHGTFISFYDVRTLLNETKPQKMPFAYYELTKDGNNRVIDLKWNPATPNLVAMCLNDGSITVLQVTDAVSAYATLPATVGVTSVCWSPKGKQLAVGKQNGTIVQFLPNLQEKKVIPCPTFYSENPVKVLDVLWVSTYVFAVAYAAADVSLETSPELVMVLLPKKEDKKGERFLNFREICYGSPTERHHHFFLNYIDNWEVLLGASAVSIEVSVIARPPDQVGYELWLLEDTSRADLPVNDNSDDTLPMGVVVDYTNQQQIFISEEKVLPPTPVLLVLSSDGVLCPFHMINSNPGMKSLMVPLERLPLEGERQTKTIGTGLTSPAPAAPQTTISQPATFSIASSNPATNTTPGPTNTTFGATNTTPVPAPWALPLSIGSTAASNNSSKQVNPPVFSFQPMSGTGVFGMGSSGPGSSALPEQTPVTTPGFLPAASVKVNLKDKFNAVGAQAPAPSASLGAPAFSFTPPSKPPSSSDPRSGAVSFQPQATKTPSRATVGDVVPVMPSTPIASTQKTAKINPPAAKQMPSQLQANVPRENPYTQTKESDPFLIAIKEEIAQFQKEMDDLKARTVKACFSVGNEAEIRQLRTETDDLDGFLLEIKETTESLNSDIHNLKRNHLEAFAKIEEARELNERKQDPKYRHLLLKRPLDPKSEAQVKEIRTLHQYVKSAVQDVSDVLDIQWEKYLENKRNQKGLIVPERQSLFHTLVNNREIINHQQRQLKQLVDKLQQLRLYKQLSQWSIPSEDTSNKSFESNIESLQNTLSKTAINMKPKPAPQAPSKVSKVKVNQLRNFLTMRTVPRIRSLAPANLNRSSFLAPSFFENLDDVSSTSSLSDTGDNEERGLLPQVVGRHETPPPEGTPIRTPRHAAVVRTTSVQQGFAPPTAPFGKPFGPGPITSTPAVPAQSIRVIPQGADSTMLTTKTVKHGDPIIIAQQAAAAAALRRQLDNQVTATLTESTLQTVPKVVNVKELKGNGPGPTISTTLGPSVPHSAAQVIQQVLVSVGSAPAKQAPPAGAIKMQSAPVLPGSIALPGQGSAPSKPPGQPFPKSETPPVPPAASTTSATASQSSKPFSFAGPSSGFSFGGVTPASSSSSNLGGSTAGSLDQSRDPNQSSPFTFGSKPVFGSGSLGSFSFSSVKSATPSTITDTASTPPTFQLSAPSAAGLAASSTTGGKSEATATKQGDGIFQTFSGGETLGSFSGLRVGQIDESSKPDNSKATPSTQPAKLPSATPVFGSGGGLQISKPAEVSSSTSGAPGTLFGSLPLAGAGSSASLFSSGASKPNFSFLSPSSTVAAADSSSGTTASATLSFQSLLAPATSAQSPAASSPANQNESSSTPAASTFALSSLLVPSSADVSSSTLEVKQPFKSDKLVSEPAAPPSLQQQNPSFPTSEGDKEQTPKQNLVGGASTTPFASVAASIIPTAQSAAVTKEDAAPIPSLPATVSSGQVSSIASEVLNPSAPVNTLSGVLSTQTPAPVTSSPPVAPNNPPTAPPPVGSTASSSAFGQQSVASSTPAALPAFGQAPASSSAPTPFAQQSGNATSAAANTTTGFGTNAFGLAGSTGAGFGQPSFGQAPAYWKTPASNSASNFSFAPSSFGTQPAFGQPPTSTVAASSTGALFGSSVSSNSATTFGQQSASASTPTAGGTGLFGQSTTPAFGQSSGFGQVAPVFGNASSSTTTTSFGQSSGFTTNPAGSLFGQNQNQSTSVFGQSPSSSGGLFGASTGTGSGGGFFSGLGGKPSQDAANKNPFGSSTPTSTARFRFPSSPNGNSLFGNSGAKAFGFGSSAFGDQKSSGTFSAAGSVASQGFGFTSPTKTGGFGAAPVFGSPPTFGGSPGFGGAPAFGTAPAFSSPLGSTGGKVFGEGTAAANTGGFGFGASPGNTTFGNIASQNTPTFGSLSQQGTGFGEQQSGGFSGFGSSGSAPPAANSGGFGFGVANHQAQPAFCTNPLGMEYIGGSSGH
ncbi:nuclear pore complex protein Nup214 isoform X1 [Pelobates fuscus]|uniref:nuclear pore complex protein Nup214 isoform X1 n=1 Tax=Pelobates fuscus TaxID=191477 RepID=UPI002FE4E74D